MLSRRINKIEESGIRKVFAEALKLGKDGINLSIGQPHFPTPDDLKEAMIKAVKENFNSYMPTLGYLPLREKISSKLENKNHINARVEDIIITDGVSGALFLLFASILDPGDEIISPDPYFVMYEQLACYFGASFIRHDTYPDFRLRASGIIDLINERTKAIIINSPNNPTGAVYDQEELKELADIAREKNILIISDEIYEAYDYEKKFFSIGCIYENTVTLNGFSKYLSITGWRLGYAHGPREIIEAMNKLQMYSFVCAPSIAQAAVANIDIENRKIFDYKPNRDYLIKNLDKKYELNIPEGAFYAFIKAPIELKEFQDKCSQNSLLIVPGAVFSQKTGYFRLSFAVERGILEKGVEILNKI